MGVSLVITYTELKVLKIILPFWISPFYWAVLELHASLCAQYTPDYTQVGSLNSSTTIKLSSNVLCSPEAL